MTLTRDSSFWWVAILGALFTYLIGKQIPPTEWAYQDWIQFGAAVVATVSGKLSHSGLPSSSEAKVEKAAEEAEEEAKK